MALRCSGESTFGTIDHDTQIIYHISDTANCTYLRWKHGRSFTQSNDRSAKKMSSQITTHMPLLLGTALLLNPNTGKRPTYPHSHTQTNLPMLDKRPTIFETTSPFSPSYGSPPAPAKSVSDSHSFCSANPRPKYFECLFRCSSLLSSSTVIYD
jgi:hypothetical protein